MQERLVPYYKLKKSTLHERLGPDYFLGETYRVVQGMLRRGIEIESIFLTQQWYQQLEAEILARGIAPERIIQTSEAEMEKVVGFNLHQGIMAIGKKPKNLPLALLGNRVLAFDHIVNPENVGSMVRSGVGFGYTHYLFDHQSAHPYIRRAVRVSMGNVFHTQICEVESLFLALRQLKEDPHPYRIIGSDARRATHSLAQYRFPERHVLIIGSETAGMSQEIFECCDDIIQIESESGSHALNASHAATLLMYRSWTQGIDFPGTKK